MTKPRGEKHALSEYITFCLRGIVCLLEPQCARVKAPEKPRYERRRPTTKEIKLAAPKGTQFLQLRDISVGVTRGVYPGGSGQRENDNGRVKGVTTI